MGNKWNYLPFTEAVEVNPSVPLKRGKIYPFVDMKAVESSRRGASESESREFKSGGARFMPFDTLMARITPCLENGKIARYIPSEGVGGPAFGSTEFIVIRGREGVTDNDYAYYLTKWEEFRQFAISQMTGSSGRQRVPADSLAKFLAPAPESLSEQRAIAHILGSLDDKIELNRQMAQTLESIARAIFKSWFVDFDPVKAKMEGKQPEGMTEEIAALFPDRLVDSELGMIPEGWDTIVLSEIVDIHSGGTPKTKVSEYWNGTIPWYSVVDAPNDGEVFVVTTSKSITDMGLNNSSTKILPIGSTIISARGTVGKLAVTCSKMTMNQSCYALKGLYGDFFTYYTISEEVDWLKQNAHGAVFDTITRATFKEISIVLPNTEIIRMYESLVLPLMERIKVLLYESNTLAELRDTLLPRLISGNIRVNQPEDAAE